eukprot:GHVU01068201.1.p1 GENE.GHVU01068201.1~~GHVU01068201.1.p1  ORF type:complete len:458 (+),score=41.56 GHVU01068201.1:393-1766(+)
MEKGKDVKSKNFPLRSHGFYGAFFESMVLKTLVCLGLKSPSSKDRSSVEPFPLDVEHDDGIDEFMKEFPKLKDVDYCPDTKAFGTRLVSKQGPDVARSFKVEHFGFLGAMKEAFRYVQSYQFHITEGKPVSAASHKQVIMASLPFRCQLGGGAAKKRKYDLRTHGTQESKGIHYRCDSALSEASEDTLNTRREHSLTESAVTKQLGLDLNKSCSVAVKRSRTKRLRRDPWVDAPITVDKLNKEEVLDGVPLAFVAVSTSASDDSDDSPPSCISGSPIEVEDPAEGLFEEISHILPKVPFVRYDHEARCWIGPRMQAFNVVLFGYYGAYARAVNASLPHYQAKILSDTSCYSVLKRNAQTLLGHVSHKGLLWKEEDRSWEANLNLLRNPRNETKTFHTGKSHERYYNALVEAISYLNNASEEKNEENGKQEISHPRWPCSVAVAAAKGVSCHHMAAGR